MHAVAVPNLVGACDKASDSCVACVVARPCCLVVRRLRQVHAGGMLIGTMLLLTALAVSLSGPSRNGKAGWALLEVTIQLLADGLNAPIFPAAPDDSSGRRFIGEQRGCLYYRCSRQAARGHSWTFDQTW